MRRLLSDAKSGELDNRGDTISLQSVQDWLTANLAAELKGLLGEILPEETAPAPDAVYESIAELLQRHPLLSLTDVAGLLERESVEIADCARQNADRLGVLGEPPLVLFRLVSEELAA